jgi:hypothetical protein
MINLECEFCKRDPCRKPANLGRHDQDSFIKLLVVIVTTKPQSALVHPWTTLALL